MIPGSPLLSTWSADGSLRLYEFASNTFVPLGVAGGLTHDPTLAPPTANIGWRERIALIIRNSLDTGTVLAQGFDILGSGAGDLDLGTLGQYRAAFAAETGQAVASPNSAEGSIVYRDGDFVQNPGRDFPGGRNDKVVLALSPDAMLAATVYLSGANYILNALPANQPDEPHSYGAGSTLNLGGYIPDIMRITADNTHILLAKAGEIAVRVFRVEANAASMTELPEIPMSKPVRTVATAPFGRFVAISTLVGGVYETTIYRRVGDFYQQLQVIANLGNLLGFTADGEMLVDAARRLAYRWNATTRLFEVIANALNSVTIGAVTQSLSAHVPVVQTVARFYQIGMMRQANQEIQTSALKLTLMKSNAPVFDPSDVTFDDAVATSEVTDGAWPSGGVGLQNFSVAATGVSQASWEFDDIEHRVVGLDPIVFKYALVYEAEGSDQIPFMRIDFAEEITVAPDNRLTLILSDGKLLTFTP